jgi:hypothetical protein
MPQENHEKGPMKSHSPQPEKGARSEEKSVRCLKLDLFVFEQGTEKKDLKDQSLHHTSRGRGTINMTGFDPGERFLLSADRRDVERNRGTCPFQNTVDKTDDEEENGHVRDEDAEERVQTYSFYANNDKKDKKKNP